MTGDIKKDAAARSIANGFGRADDLAEKKSAEFSKLVDMLIRDPSKRDASIFTAAGVNPMLTVEQIIAVPIIKRNAEWRANFERIIAASQVQARTQLLSRELIITSGSALKKNQSAISKLNPSQQRELAKTGIGKQLFDDEKQAVKNGTTTA